MVHVNERVNKNLSQIDKTQSKHNCKKKNQRSKSNIIFYIQYEACITNKVFKCRSQLFQI